MRLPSVKTLLILWPRENPISDETLDKAKRVRQLLERVKLNPSRYHLNWDDSHPLTALRSINTVMNGFGVEHVARGNNRQSPAFDYVNTGETYATTLVYFPQSESFRVTSWGDIVERGNYP